MRIPPRNTPTTVHYYWTRDIGDNEITMRLSYQGWEVTGDGETMAEVWRLSYQGWEVWGDGETMAEVWRLSYQGWEVTGEWRNYG